MNNNLQERTAIRIFYIAAAGDLAAAYQSWKRGLHIDSEVARTYSGSIFDFSRKYGLEGTFLAVNPAVSTLQDGGICIRNVQMPVGGRGIKYYINWLVGSTRLLWKMLRERPRVAMVSDRTIFFPLLFIAKIFGIKIINIMHVAFYSDVKNPSGIKRLLLKMDTVFLRWGSDYILGVSKDIIAQSDHLCGGKAPPGVAFAPQWNRDRFDEIFDKRPSGETFSISFLGRIEPSKGIFDLLQAFIHLRDKGYRLQLDFLGDGSALGELRQEIAQLGLSDLVRTHGHCARDRVIDALARTHLVVVPTRSEFVEGLNKVAIEAVLAGRPVVTSPVCQALSLIREAVFEATPDDWMSYADRIEQAMTDPLAYGRAVAAARELREQFFTPTSSIGHKLEKAFADLDLLGPRHAVEVAHA